MPLKLNVGLSRKIGLPNYSSLGASCHVEVELDGGLLSDMERFQHHVRTAFCACQQAVASQLAGQHSAQAPPVDAGFTANGAPSPESPRGRSNRPQGRMRPATENQARAIRIIASQQQVNLTELLNTRYGVNEPEELSVRDASSLIDELNGHAAPPSRPRLAG